MSRFIATELNMPDTAITPSGKRLAHVTHKTTTSTNNQLAKKIRIESKQKKRRDENDKYLNNANVKAFLGMIIWAEGGGYDFKFGAIDGKNNDKWRFTDYSTHPGPGSDKHTTAAGAYQITKDTWKDHGIESMGLSDFSPHTQDLIAVDKLRRMNAIDALVDGNFAIAMRQASYPWAALEQGSGLGNRYPKQPYKKYQDCLAKYKELGGTEK